MATGLEDDEQEIGEGQWVELDDIELPELCAAYRERQTEKKLHESAIKDIDKQLQELASKLQEKMGGHRSVRTLFGYTLQWVRKARQPYMVAGKEWDQWELRSPF